MYLPLTPLDLGSQPKISPSQKTALHGYENDAREKNAPVIKGMQDQGQAYFNKNTYDQTKTDVELSIDELASDTHKPPKPIDEFRGPNASPMPDGIGKGGDPIPYPAALQAGDGKMPRFSSLNTSTPSEQPKVNELPKVGAGILGNAGRLTTPQASDTPSKKEENLLSTDNPLAKVELPKGKELDVKLPNTDEPDKKAGKRQTNNTATERRLDDKLWRHQNKLD